MDDNFFHFLVITREKLLDVVVLIFFPDSDSLLMLRWSLYWVAIDELGKGSQAWGRVKAGEEAASGVLRSWSVDSGKQVSQDPKEGLVIFLEDYVGLSYIFTLVARE